MHKYFQWRFLIAKMREFGFKAKQMGKAPSKGVWEHVSCKKKMGERVFWTTWEPLMQQ